MQITLMRHGKPVMAASKWMAPADLGDWIRRYDLADVEPLAPGVCLGLAASATFIASSTTRRALSSVRALDRTASSVDPIYGEAALPYAHWRGPRLPVAVWVVLFRLFWFMGFAQHADTVKTTQSRAKVAALKLAAEAERGPVLLVGHGLMNRFIGQALLAQGWARTRSRARGSHWGTCTYERELA